MFVCVFVNTNIILIRFHFAKKAVTICIGALTLHAPAPAQGKTCMLSIVCSLKLETKLTYPTMYFRSATDTHDVILAVGPLLLATSDAAPGIDCFRRMMFVGV